MKKEFKEYYDPKFQIVSKLIRLLYDLDGYVCGGCCHIVTDDNNIRNSDLEFVIEYSQREENKNNIDSELSSTICQIMLHMTIEQRIILFYILEDGGFYFEDFDESEYEYYFQNVISPQEIIKRSIETERYNIEE